MSTEKFDAAVLGLGGMGGTHVGAAKASPHVNKIYGYEPDPERRKQRAEELGIIPADLPEILANPEIKFVSIASSNNTHIELAEAALRAGKKVMCEKPMGDTLEEATHLIKVKQELNGFLQIGFELHYSRLYMKAKEWIDQGLIGKVVNIQTRYLCTVNHSKGSWRSKGKGSFLIGEKLSHYLDLQRWFMGSEPETVYSVSSPRVLPSVEYRDNHNITTTFKNGGIGVLVFTAYTAESYHGEQYEDLLAKQRDDGHVLQYLIIGDKGMIETDVFARRIRRWTFTNIDGRLESARDEEIRYPQALDNAWIHNTAGQNVQIMDLISKGLPPGVPAEDAYQTMRFCFAAGLSEDTGRIVRMDELPDWK